MQSKIALICAMDEELQPLLEVYKSTAQLTHSQAGLSYYQINSHFFAVVSGIGKVNAALATQIMIDHFQPDLIINIGIAGLLQPLPAGTNINQLLVIGQQLIQHDFDTTAFGDQLGQIPRLDRFAFESEQKLINLADQIGIQNNFHPLIGTIVSGDQFVAEKAKKQFLRDHFQALACEMEGAAIAQVAYLNGLPFIVLRTISDVGDDQAVESYQIQKDKSIVNYRNFLIDFVSTLAQGYF